MVQLEQTNLGSRGSQGGPRTFRGKRASRRNALKHGLGAETLLPEVLGRDLVRQCYRRLCDEWQPASPTQNFLVMELARHEAALQRIQEMEQAVLRQGARGAPGIPFAGGDSDALLDAELAGAGTSEALERIARYRKPHERAYLRSLATLRQAKALPEGAKTGPSQEKGRVFDSEEACEAYLVARRTDEGSHCPRCASTAGKWISSRNVWQCEKCRRQTGIRATTIMEKSHLSLLAWFGAIKALLHDPSTSTAKLSAVTGIRRAGTVRRMAGQIRQAMDSPQRSVLLAGLDRVFGPPTSNRAEPNVRKK